jgi:hypothetical protein
MIYQDHRLIKKIIKLMMGFKAFHSAKATLDEIQAANMIWKDQHTNQNIPAYKKFMAILYGIRHSIWAIVVRYFLKFSYGYISNHFRLIMRTKPAL